jgi:hypothetical protein
VKYLVKPYAEQAEGLGLTTDVSAAHAAVAAMLDPVLCGRLTVGTWNPAAKRWT